VQGLHGPGEKLEVQSSKMDLNESWTWREQKLRFRLPVSSIREENLTSRGAARIP
jgi:hypothetical protein